MIIQILLALIPIIHLVAQLIRRKELVSFVFDIPEQEELRLSQWRRGYFLSAATAWSILLGAIMIATHSEKAWGAVLISIGVAALFGYAATHRTLEKLKARPDADTLGVIVQRRLVTYYGIHLASFYGYLLATISMVIFGNLGHVF